MSAVGTVKIQILQPIVQEVEEKVTQPVAQTVYVRPPGISRYRIDTPTFSL